MTNALKPTYVYKRFRVKRADGGSTTVSVDPALVVKACQVLGSLSTVSRIVREAALKFDPAASTAAKNRSAHVSRTLKTIVANKGVVPSEKSTEHVNNTQSVEQLAKAAVIEPSSPRRMPAEAGDEVADQAVSYA